MKSILNSRLLVRSPAVGEKRGGLLVCVNISTKLFSVDTLLYLLNFYEIHGLSGLKFHVV